VNKIPPEIDQMIWTVAEQGNPNAETEFLRRYPLYREELLRRKAAVSGLKKSNPHAAPVAKAVPRFVPREVPKAKPAPRLVLAVGLLGLLTLAVASYTVTSMLTPAPAQHVIVPEPPAPVRTDPVVPYVPPVVRQETPHNPVTPPLNTGTPPEFQTPRYMRPKTLVVKKAGLVDVLRLIEGETGMRVVVAPGMPNPSVAVEYHDMTAIEMLQDLGQRYQFTPFDQNDGSVVVYPVVDDSAATGPIRRIGG